MLTLWQSYIRWTVVQLHWQQLQHVFVCILTDSLFHPLSLMPFLGNDNDDSSVLCKTDGHKQHWTVQVCLSTSGQDFRLIYSRLRIILALICLSWFQACLAYLRTFKLLVTSALHLLGSLWLPRALHLHHFVLQYDPAINEGSVPDELAFLLQRTGTLEREKERERDRVKRSSTVTGDICMWSENRWHFTNPQTFSETLLWLSPRAINQQLPVIPSDPKASGHHHQLEPASPLV